MISIAEQCQERLELNRPLITGPAFLFKGKDTIKKYEKYSKTSYKTESGEPTNRKDIMRQYDLTARHVYNIFTKLGDDYEEAHRQLLISSKRVKSRLGIGIKK